MFENKKIEKLQSSLRKRQQQNRELKAKLDALEKEYDEQSRVLSTVIECKKSWENEIAELKKQQKECQVYINELKQVISDITQSYEKVLSLYK